MKRLAIPLLALTLIALSSGTAATWSSSGGADALVVKKSRLQAFRSCGELLSHVKGHATRLAGPWGIAGEAAQGRPAIGATPATPGRAAGAPGVDYSTTNVQEAGVDEPDIVKSDGARLFAVAGTNLHAVDVRTGRPRLLGSLPLRDGWGHELLLHGDRLLVLSRGPAVEPLPVGARTSIAPIPAGTILTEVDVSDPAAIRVVRTLTFDGTYVSARLVGTSVRVVAASSAYRGLEFVAPTQPGTQGSRAAAEKNRAVVASSRLANWLPSYVVRQARSGKTTKRALVQCRDVRRPAAFSGLGTLTVLTIDLDQGLQPVDSDSVLTDGQIVYASPSSLYVATQRWADRPVPGDPAVERQGITTALHKFDTSLRTRTEYRASGEVSGFLVNQWALSEHRGVLRVASTDTPVWWTPSPRQESESFVTVLEERSGKLVAVGRVGDLGRGERIYATRFIGDVGYVVTFRQTDPLYTVDLSDPARPRVLGELKILGYSSYLHPVDGDLLLGVGQDATEQGQVLGTQLSLFDISDVRRPARLHRRTIGPGASEAEYDHHAFLYWPSAGLAVLPVQAVASSDGGVGQWLGGVIGFRIGRNRGIVELGRVTHGAGSSSSPIRRSLVVRNALYTVSELGVKSSDLGTLADLGWVPFR